MVSNYAACFTLISLLCTLCQTSSAIPTKETHSDIHNDPAQLARPKNGTKRSDTWTVCQWKAAPRCIGCTLHTCLQLDNNRTNKRLRRWCPVSNRCKTEGVACCSTTTGQADTVPDTFYHDFSAGYKASVYKGGNVQLKSGGSTDRGVFTHDNKWWPWWCLIATALILLIVFATCILGYFVCADCHKKGRQVKESPSTIVVVQTPSQCRHAAEGQPSQTRIHVHSLPRDEARTTNPHQGVDGDTMGPQSQSHKRHMLVSSAPAAAPCASGGTLLGDARSFSDRDGPGSMLVSVKSGDSVTASVAGYQSLAPNSYTSVERAHSTASGNVAVQPRHNRPSGGDAPSQLPDVEVAGSDTPLIKDGGKKGRKSDASKTSSGTKKKKSKLSLKPKKSNKENDE